MESTPQIFVKLSRVNFSVYRLRLTETSTENIILIADVNFSQ